MIHLETPIKQSDILKLKAGDKILLSGTIFTARDKAHKFLLENDFRLIQGAPIYHCGPIVDNGEVIAAGPTTSARLNSYTPELIKKYQTKIIIGKGGMDSATLSTMRGKAVYLSATGGAAVLYADKIKLKKIHKKEFGPSEAIYEFEAKDFPAIVTMDAKGKSLYNEIYKKSKKIHDQKIK